MNSSVSAIKVLIAICLVMFVITYMVPGMLGTMRETFALFFPKNEHFRIWQFVTNIFMHGGFAHIFFNMYALWAFGSPLEKLWGRKRFYVFFLLSGIGAAVIYTLINYYQYNNIYNDLIAAGATDQDITALLRGIVPSGEWISVVGEKTLTDFVS